MADKMPRPYINDVKQDNSTMVYPNGGDFAITEIGARKSGQPKDTKSSGMGLTHVGNGTGGK